MRINLEKNITLIKGATGDSYYTQVWVNDKRQCKSFRALEEAREYVIKMKELRKRKESNYPYDLIDYLFWGEKIDIEFWGEKIDIEYVENKFDENFEYAMRYFGEREREIMKQYYKNGLTLESIGLKEGITRCRVQQILEKGLRKLRYRRDTIRYGKEVEELYDDIEALKVKLELQKERLIGELKNKEDDVNKALEIEDVGLSRRTYNCLKRYGINYVYELKGKSERELMKIRNLGQKSLKEVKELMKSKGLLVEEVEEEEEKYYDE